VLLENAIQRILPRTSDYHKITYLTHPRALVAIRVTKFYVQKNCNFLRKFSVSCRSHNKYYSTKTVFVVMCEMNFTYNEDQFFFVQRLNDF
jgi:hypothetical protein